jgi:hypothetical protein
MKINELIAEQQNIEEGIGSFLGKAAGHVAGGVGAAWRDAKQGYKDAKAVWDPKDPPGTYNNDPATNGAAPVGGPNPDELRKQAAELTKQADQIEKTASQPAPAPTTPPPAPTNTTAPAAQTEPAAPDQWPAGLPKFNSVTGQKFTSPEEAEQVTNSPEFKQQMADVAAGKDPGGVQATQQTAPAPTTPAPTEPAARTPPAPTTPPASTPPPAGGKMTQAQQDALKAKLQGQRQAGKTTATQTGSGFKNYVGGSGERMTGVDASGAPIYQKIQRESVEFRSNFLGMMI